MPSFKHTLFSVLCLFVLNFSVNAFPLRDRQANGSQILNTVTTEMTPDGPVTANCTIVLTPIKDKNGQMAVEEVKTCNLILDPSPSQPTASAIPIETSSQNPPATKSNTKSTADSTTSSAASITTASTTTSAAPSGGSGAISTHPVSTVTVSSSSVPTSSSSSSGVVSAQPVSTVTTNTSTSVSSSVSAGFSSATTTSAGASSTAAAAAANASDVSSTTSAADGTPSRTSAAADSANNAVIPGKSLAVLPIGLGIFAGISVIALIVVGLVTYERRKYRKAFRERKLAESGAAMGYGGMAQ